MGNPTTYTETLAEALLNGLWEGKTLPEIQQEHPELKRRTISDWCEDHPQFGVEYRMAMVGGAHHLIDETTTIVDNLKEPSDSRKVRAWQRFELAKRKAPHVLGDRVTLAGDKEAPLSGLSDEELDRRIAEKMAKLGAP